MRLFRKDFQRNAQHSIQIPDITKRNPNVRFILGNTGHAWRGLTVTLLKVEFWSLKELLTSVKTQTKQHSALLYSVSILYLIPPQGEQPNNIMV